MARLVHVHHVDKDAFLKGNIELDPDELDLVFDRSPNYAEVLKQVRIDLDWMDPSDVVELEGRRNVGFGMHIRWKTMCISSEQRWVAYKETVAESHDKALELFATRKVDASLHLDLNRRASPIEARSSPPMTQDEPILTQESPPMTQEEPIVHRREEANDDDNDGALFNNNVGDLDTYCAQENMNNDVDRHHIPYSRGYAYDSDDDGPDEEVDEDGLTAK